MMIGKRIGPFEIERELGSGAMGTVYKAKFHRDDGKIIAIAMKIISFGLLGNEAALARFEREANILKQLRHAHIVRLFATGRYKKTPFIAMEFVDGESLDRVLARRSSVSGSGGRMHWQELIRIGVQLCGALQHAHEKGIIHRDLKPSNLMMTTYGDIKLTDFGIAKDTDVTALTNANSTIGTAAYMSPEQCRGDRNLTAKSDLYSLGVVFYELLTGVKPFRAETALEMFTKHVTEVPVRPGQVLDRGRPVAPDLPIWLDNLVMFLLEKDKDHRPMDAATVGRMLSEIEEKVRSGASVGAEIASARRMDRIDRPEAIDEEDIDAARSLRGSSTGKKKKKKKPEPKGVLLKAILLGGLLLAVVGFAGYNLLPEGIEPAFKKVELASDPDGKLNAATDFLKSYGSRNDPRIKQALTIFKEGKTKKIEAILAQRYKTKFNSSEPFEREAYETAFQALDQEAKGHIKQAGTTWEVLGAKTIAAEASLATDEERAARAAFTWYAERRSREINRDLPAKVDDIKAKVKTDRLAENERSYVLADPNGLAIRAFALEAFKDLPKARRLWEKLAAFPESSDESRILKLLGKQEAARLEDAPKDNTAARVTRVEEIVKSFETELEALKKDPKEQVKRRDLKYKIHEFRTVYDDETDPEIVEALARAKKIRGEIDLPASK